MSNMNYDRDRYGPEYGEWERAPDRDRERNRGAYRPDREGGYERNREEPYRSGRWSDQGSDYVYSQGQGVQGNQYGQPSPYDQSGRPGNRYGQPEQYAQQSGYRTAGRYGGDRWWEDERHFGPRGVMGWEGGGYKESWQVPGPYTGRGPRDYQRSDERIQEDILDRLTQHGQIDASDISVQVSSGDVTLTGAVNTRQEKHMAEDVAESVTGVRDIQNQIKVRQGLANQARGIQTPESQESQRTSQETRTH